MSGAPIAGVVVVDKPVGPTSHDAVARLRRTLGTRRVGHGGTLDPTASGVLVVLAGEATKLAPYVTAHDKRYEARVVLGAATATLDFDGAVTAEASVPEPLARELRALAAGEAAPLLDAALAAERARRSQRPPAYSAIHVGGRRSYDLARAGEDVPLEPRSVCVHAIRATGAGWIEGPGDPRAYLDLEVEVSKGYYVRALARDLGERLGVPAHLGALRRTASGPFSLASAVELGAPQGRVLGAMRSIVEAASLAMPVARLTAEGAERARQGKRLTAGDFAEPAPEGGAASAWLDPGGRLVAIGEVCEGTPVVRRGFGGADDAE